MRDSHENARRFALRRSISASAALAALLGLAPAAAATSSASGVRINELNSDAPTQVGEFVELFALGGTSLDDHFLVFVDGASDDVYRTVDLDGLAIPADGVFVVGDTNVVNVDYTPPSFLTNNNAILNGADAVALYFDPSGALASADFNGKPIQVMPAAAVLIDALVYDTNDPDDAVLLSVLTPGEIQANEAANGSANPDSLQRVPDGGAAFAASQYVTTTATPGVRNAPAPTTSPVRINEVDAASVNNVDEFVELHGPGDALLNEHFLVHYDGGPNSAYRVIDLDGLCVPPDGFFVVGDANILESDLLFDLPGDALKNGPDAVALFLDPTGLLVAADFDGTPVDSPPAGAVLIDAVVYDTNDNDDAQLLAALTPGQPQVNEGANNTGNTESIQRFPDGGVAFDTGAYDTFPPTPGAPNKPVSPLRLSEIRAGFFDYVEITGPAGTSLKDHLLVFYDGADDAQYRTRNLDGHTMDVTGTFVVAMLMSGADINQSTLDLIENGTAAVALWYDATHSLPASAFANTLASAPPAGAYLIDAVVYGNDKPDDLELLAALTPGQPQVNASWLDSFGASTHRAYGSTEAFDSASWSWPSQNTPKLGHPALLRINEVDALADDGMEFVEISGPPGLDLRHTYLILVDASPNPIENEVLAAAELFGSVPGNGLFVVGDPGVPGVDNIGFFGNGDDLPDGSYLLAIVRETTGEMHAFEMVGEDYSFGFTGSNTLFLTDHVVYGPPGSADSFFMSVVSNDFKGPVGPEFDQLHEDALGLGQEHSLQRRPDGGLALDTSLTVLDSPTPGAPNASVWTDLGQGLAGSTGTPAFHAVGAPADDRNLLLVLEGAKPFGTTTLVIGISQIAAPFKGGTLVPHPDLLVPGLPLSPQGDVTVPLLWPVGLTGVPFWFQHWVQDAGGPVGFAASNALTVVGG